MRLTQFSNFAVRILMFAGLKGQGVSPVPVMARAYGISHDHLKKAAAELCRRGLLKAMRGRSGGFRLADAPERINVGAVVRCTEGATPLVECFEPATSTCPLISKCRFRSVLIEAHEAFYAILDRYTLDDLIANRDELRALVGLNQARTDAAPGTPHEPLPVPCGLAAAIDL